MGRLSAVRLSTAALILTAHIFLLSYSQSLSIVSSSAFVGDTSANYTFVLTNVSTLTTVTFNFQSWSPLTQTPYSSSTKCYLASTALICTPFPSNQIQCALSLPGSGQNINLTLTAMTNPSSTKPYPISLTLANSSSSQSVSGQLTVSSLLNFPLSIQGYSKVIGATSSAISIDIVMNNYIDSTTYLSLSYNTTLISSILFPNTTNYNVLLNANGSVLITNWNNLQSGKVTLTGVAITNPQAAISYAITGLFYFKSGSNTYNIQTVSTSVTLTVVAFTTLTIASPLSYGVLSTLTVTSSCNFAQISSSNSSNPAYTSIDFPSELQATSTSTCVPTSSTTCQHTKNGSYTLTNFQAGIGSYTSTSLTFTQYTYYAGTYYPLCKSTASVSFALQGIAPYVVSSECDTTIASLSNAISIYSSVQSAAAGDVLYINGLKGVITSTGWTQLTINGSIWYSFTLSSSNVATNGSSKVVTAPITYNNPNETTTNSINQLTISRNNTQYAYMLGTTITLCSITSGRPISASSTIPTSYNTYDIINMTLGFTFQIYDYAYNDYLTLAINSNALAKQYFLAGSLLSITPNLTVNGVYCSFSIVNDYTLKIVLDNGVSLPTSNSPTLNILLINLVNPPAVDNYWFSLTTVDQPTGGTKEVLASTSPLTLKVNTLTTSIADVYELANNSVSLVITNPNRLILSKNNSSASTTVSMTLPATLSCSNFASGAVSASWNVGILTSSSSTSGTTTSLTINLGTCFVFYFSSSITFTVSQTFSSAQSSSTAVSIYNKCGSCYQCSNSQCTACFNSTYTTSIYYYQNQCYTTCPTSTYTSNSICYDCHSSCQTCTGPLFTDCTSCSQNFVLSSGYCSSICGSGKYQSNGNCISCHPNCQSCTSYSVCYVCKSGAVMIGTQCQFSSCTSPCLTCFGSLTSCTSCVSPMLIYESQCYSSCPSGTYQTGNTCAVINESSTYVPVTITGAVCFMLLVLLRVYSSKKIGNESRRRKSYQQEDVQINYKINLLRVASVLFSYLQLAAALVLLLKDSTYSVGSSPVAAAAIGLALHFVCNIAFLVAYIRMVYMKKVENDALEESQDRKDTSIRYKVIIVLSAVFSLRTYKLLDANLFLDRRGTDRPKEGIPSRKLIRSNSLGDQNQEVVIQRTDSVVVVPPHGRFEHPFLTYLTMIDLVVGTLPVLIGAIIQILAPVFMQMLLWGVDCLLVGVVSLGLTGWDLWIFANLHPSEQHSEMSSRQQANNTHENLKQLTDFDIKIEPEKPPQSPKKQTNRGKMSQRTQKSKERPKEKEDMSMEGVRGGVKRECDEQTVARGDEPIPHLKVFDDFDEKDENVLNEKKTKKFSTKNLRRGDKKLSSRRINPTSYRRNPLGQVCDDLYINFAADEPTLAPTLNATHMHSRPSASPNRSLQEESIEVGGQFEDQPPNFADISDIEQGGPEAINISLSSQPHPPDQ